MYKIETLVFFIYFGKERDVDRVNKVTKIQNSSSFFASYLKNICKEFIFARLLL